MVWLSKDACLMVPQPEEETAANTWTTSYGRDGREKRKDSWIVLAEEIVVGANEPSTSMLHRNWRATSLAHPLLTLLQVILELSSSSAFSSVLSIASFSNLRFPFSLLVLFVSETSEILDFVFFLHFRKLRPPKSGFLLNFGKLRPQKLGYCLFSLLES